MLMMQQGRSAEQDAASVMLMMQQTGEVQNRTQLL